MPLSVDTSQTLSLSLFRVSDVIYVCSIHCTLHITCSLAPTPTPFINSNSSSLIAGTPLNLSCDYNLSTSVDTNIIATATWTVDNMPIDISDDGITSDEIYLTFSPLTTLYTGIYTCNLTITPSHQTPPHITVGSPVQSLEMDIIVQSKVHPILHVLVHIPLTSLPLSSLSTYIPLPPLSVPKPDIVVSVSPTGPLYAGTSVILTCTVTLDPAVNNNENIDFVWSCSEDIAGDEQGPISTSAMGEFNISPVAVQDNGTMFTCTGTVTGVSNVQPAINSTIYNIIVTGKLAISLSL